MTYRQAVRALMDDTPLFDGYEGHLRDYGDDDGPLPELPPRARSGRRAHREKHPIEGRIVRLGQMIDPRRER